MVTFVGHQKEFNDALKALLELEYETVEVYEMAIQKLEKQAYQETMKTFKNDHEKHVRELRKVLEAHDEKVPSSAGLGEGLLPKGKVLFSSLLGDHAILAAMRSNEIDTNRAYEHVCSRDDVWEDARSSIENGYEDEKRHKKWLEDNL